MNEEFEVVAEDEPSLEEYASMEETDYESAQPDQEAEWATEAEAEEARLKEWGIK